MNNTPITPIPGACGPGREEAVNLYADGELEAAEQPGLFAHLAACSGCRRHLEAVMAFRRMSRCESLLVPATVDAGLMKRLDAVTHRRPENTARSLWAVPLRIGFGTAAAMVAVVFLLGAGLTAGRSHPRTASITAHQERFEPQAVNTFWRVEPVYIFYPGLIVEAEKSDD